MKFCSFALSTTFFIGLVLGSVPLSEASNGMNMIGYGAKSIAMGGADLAITDGPSAMNINPAGIAGSSHHEINLGLSLMRPSLNHVDGLGNDRDDNLQRYPIPFVGYVRPAGSLSYGIGLFVQGGMGAEYEGLSTPFSAMAGQVPPEFFAGDLVPATDNTRTNIMHAKLTPTAAWQAHPTLAVGAGLNLSYARAQMQLFPNTSIMADLDRSGTVGDGPGDFFMGLEVDEMSTFAYGLRVGFQYETGDLALGGAYCTETALDFDGGTMVLNLASQGLDRVAYEASMSGFAWPQQAGLGAAYRIHPRLSIAADLDWIDWSHAIETVTIEGANPDAPAAPPGREIVFRMDWKDQWVWAVGVELIPKPDWTARLGYNHGDSPIPDSMLRPLFPAIAGDHITGGAGYRTGPWTFELGLEYAVETEKTNNSLDRAVNPFGPGSRESLSQLMVHFMVRRPLAS